MSAERIQAAALELFAAKGFEAVSIREIARAAEVNVSMISYYFGGKEQLRESIFADWQQKTASFVAERFPRLEACQEMTKQQQLEQLREYLNAVLDYFYTAIPEELIMFVLREDHLNNRELKPTLLVKLRKLLASLIGAAEDDDKVILYTAAMTAQITFVRVIPSYIKPLQSSELTMEQVAFIKENLFRYVDFVLQNEGVKL